MQKNRKKQRKKKRSFFERLWECIAGLSKGSKGKHRIDQVLCLKKVEERIRILYTGEDIQSKLKEYYVKKFKLFSGMLCVALLLGGMLFYKAQMEKELPGAGVVRGSYGEGSREEVLTAQIVEKEKQQEQELCVEVKEQQYDVEQIKTLFKNAKKELDRLILADNPSVDEISTDMNFVSTLQNGVVEVSYVSEDDEQIDSTGHITQEKRKKSGIAVQITAKLSYQDIEEDYIFGIRIVPYDQTKEGKLKEALTKQVQKEDEKSRYDAVQKLPDNVDGKNVFWEKKSSKTWLSVLVFLVFMAVLLFYVSDTKLEESLKERKEQMMIDYPEIVNKLTLLLGAGMTIFGAWSKIVEDYKRKQTQEKKKRYAYEEMVLTYYEIQDGISEMEAYQRFGTRCCVQKYLKLSALLTQNLKKGSTGLSALLEYEAVDAFEERKSQAKRIGEEAGTKLLFPMFLMLGVVMAVMLIPAFLSFQM